MAAMGFSNFQQPRIGVKRMPFDKEHLKAVYGKLYARFDEGALRRDDVV